ncbi:MAG: hypothetical protein JXA13_06755 [Anaerolineales bacterium]|nr:hypothetical protein [Anaerolineales bacterium]
MNRKTTGDIEEPSSKTRRSLVHNITGLFVTSISGWDVWKPKYQKCWLTPVNHSVTIGLHNPHHQIGLLIEVGNTERGIWYIES